MPSVALAFLIAIVAALYASVGLAGASGYLALLALFGVEPMAMKGASLLLNGVVASVGTMVFRRESASRIGPFWVLFASALPMSFLGGSIRLPGRIYLPIVGVLLIASAVRLLRPNGQEVPGGSVRRVPIGLGVVIGLGVGFVSGLTGTGGGIFLLPALQVFGWAGPREASAIVAPFVLVTSVAGLCGHLWQSSALPGGLVLWTPAAMIGGLIGARAGRDRLNPATLRRILAALLIVAGIKLLIP